MKVTCLIALIASTSAVKITQGMPGMGMDIDMQGMGPGGPGGAGVRRTRRVGGPGGAGASMTAGTPKAIPRYRGATFCDAIKKAMTAERMARMKAMGFSMDDLDPPVRACFD